jgi:diguanylate cyclase (GGDEF)-like protein/PAS domain S-box-containing protein
VGASVGSEDRSSPNAVSGPVEYESEPYVRLATLRELHQVLATVNTARSLEDTLQAIADGLVANLGYGLAGVHLVRPDGDLVVAAMAGGDPGDAPAPGRVAFRETWNQRLQAGEDWGGLRFVPYDEGRSFTVGDLAQYGDEPLPSNPDAWHPGDRLFAPLHLTEDGESGELIGVLSVDRPRSGRRPGAWGREALQMYATQAAVAIMDARLRADIQRTHARLEGEQQALRADEEILQQVLEYAPSGATVAVSGGDRHGEILRANDALCGMLGRSESELRGLAYLDLVHAEDMHTARRTFVEGGRAEVRLRRHDGTYLWASLRHSVVADVSVGPRALLTHVEDIEDRKLREQRLVHRAFRDPLTGLANLASLRTRLAAHLCDRPDGMEELHAHRTVPNDRDDSAKGLAVFFCDLDGMQMVNEQFGHATGDAVLVEVGGRLTRQGLKDDMVARYGGDEFVVLVDGLSEAERHLLMENLRAAVTSPMRIDGRTVRVGASFGSAWVVCGMSVEEALRAADLRMYEEKQTRSMTARRALVGEILPQRRTAGVLPGRANDVWVPQRPVAPQHVIRTWQTGRAETATPDGEIEIGSAREAARLTDADDVHRLVCRGDIPDLGFLRKLPALRSLVIADNRLVTALDALKGCEKLRSLTVTGCPSLSDWAGAAATGVMFVDAGPDLPTDPLGGLAAARQLRELTLRGAPSAADPDISALRRALPQARVRVMAGPTR